MRFLILLAASASWANEAVDAVFAPYTQPGSPGCAVGGLKDGQTALAKGYGMADLDHNLPITPRTRFYMASVSKQFTAFALLLAEKEGKLKLDDPVRKWVPEMPAYAEEITLRRMLDHTAGLRDYLVLWDLRGFSNESVLRLAPTLSLIAKQEALNFPVGTGHSYSNSGYLLASVALERATGKTLAEWAKDKIHTPLEMTASRFQDDHSVPVPDRAHGYRKNRGFKNAGVGFDLVGSGGMYSNVTDMLKWARNFEQKSVGGELLPQLYTPGRLKDGRPTPGGYALGMVQADGLLSHSGVAAGYSTFFLHIPADRLSVVCLCNLGGAPVREHALAVAKAFGAKIPAATRQPRLAAKRAVRAWAAGEMERLAGEYWSEELETVWTLFPRGRSLYVLTHGGEFAVMPGDEGTAQADEYKLHPARDGDGPARSFTVGSARATGIRFTRRDQKR